MKSAGRLFLSAVFFSVFVQAVSAQKIWERDWQSWKANDVGRILNNSPWAKNCRNGEVEVACGLVSSGNTNKANVTPPVIVRFYSSLKLRQAFVRLVQLQNNYDKMDDKQKSAFDEKTKSFLICENCKNYYVFTLYQSVVKENDERSVFNDKLKNEKPENLADKIYLGNDKNEKRKLAHFKMNAYQVELYFPILDDKQNPLITTDTKKMTLNLKTNFWREGAMEEVEFDVSKMLINNKLDF